MKPAPMMASFFTLVGGTFCGRRPHPDLPGEREEGAKEYFRYSRILNGTYQQEKATFAFEEAQYCKKEADESREVLQEDFSDEHDPEAARAGIEAGLAKYQQRAINWLRTTANCLE